MEYLDKLAQLNYYKEIGQLIICGAFIAGVIIYVLYDLFKHRKRRKK